MGTRIRHAAPLRLLLMAVIALAGGRALAAPAAGQAASLRYSTPELGRLFTLTVEGAPPGAQVVMLLSPRAASIPVPQGMLELDPASLQVVGALVADAAGNALASAPIPVSELLAETPVHLQALVADPSGPGGLRLSTAVHFRVLGSRLYAADAAGGLTVFSAAAGGLLFRTDFDAESEEPVFSANRALGAVVTPPTTSPRDPSIAIFDNSFGGTLHRIPADNVSTRLIARGRSLYAYDGASGTIARIDFATGAVTGILPLANPLALGPTWIGDDAGEEAYVPDRIGTRPALRRIDLVAMADRGATQLLALPAFVEDVSFAQGRVQALCRRLVGGTPIYELARVDFSQTPPTIDGADLDRTGGAYGRLSPDDRPGHLLLPEADTLLSWRDQDAGGTIPFEARATPLSTGPSAVITPPAAPFGTGTLDLAYAVASGGTAWIAERRQGPADGVLWRYERAGGTWTPVVPALALDPGRSAVIHDVFRSVVIVGLDHPAPSVLIVDARTLGFAVFSVPALGRSGGTFFGTSVPAAGD